MISVNQCPILFLYGFVDYVGDNAPDVEVHFSCDLDRCEMYISWLQKKFITVIPNSFHGQFTIYGCYNYFLFLGLKCPVNNENISRMYPGIDHGITFHAYKKSCCRMFYEKFIKIECGLYIITCRRGETCFDLRFVHRELEFCALLITHYLCDAFPFF